MYLSRMYLNPARRGTRDLMANPHKLHAAVCKCFPRPEQIDEPSVRESEGRLLWRIEHSNTSTTLWVVSPSEPSFEHLQEQAGWSKQATWRTRPYDKLLDRLEEGQTYAFHLTANPVHHISTDGGPTRRTAHLTARHQTQWLLDRQETLGARLVSDNGEPSVTVVGSRRLQFRRGSSKVTLGQADYSGALEVMDPEALRAVLCRGIGKAKGYGCGLLTLAQVPTKSY